MQGSQPSSTKSNSSNNKVNYGFFYQQQQQQNNTATNNQQQQYQSAQQNQQSQNNQMQNNIQQPPSLITQVNKNQQPHADLSQDQKQQLANQQQQQYQKFGKEPLPPHLAACGQQKPWATGKKTLVLDLDETLVHSSFKPPAKPDIVLPVEIEGNVCNVFVLIRPGTEFFLQRLAKCYEIVIYTASLSKYADPLIDILDNKPQKIIDYRLFREHCTFFQGVFIKDMSLPGRPLQDSIIIDNSPTSYAFHQENALPILSWYDDPKDRCLFELIPLLESLAEVDDVRKYIPKFVTADHKVDFQRASYILSNATPKKQKTLKQHTKKISNQQLNMKEAQSDSEKRQEEVEEIENEEIDDGVVVEIKQSGRKSITKPQNRSNKNDQSLKLLDISKSQTTKNSKNQQNTFNDNKDDEGNDKDDMKNKNKYVKNNQWTLEETQEQQNTANLNDQSQRNFSKQRHDEAAINNKPSLKDLNQEKIQLNTTQQIQQQQQNRPITRDNKRRDQQQLQQDEINSSPTHQGIKNALAQTSTNKSRKLNNQQFSRQSQLHSLLQTDQQQFKKSFNAPSSNQYNPTMTDANIKMMQPSKTPNAKHGTGHIQFPRDNLSLSMQRQQQAPINIMNVQGMFNTPKHALQNSNYPQPQHQQHLSQQQYQLQMNQTNQLFKFFPNQQMNSASAHTSQSNSEVNTFRGQHNSQQQRELSNKNLIRNSIQLQLNDFKGQHFINKQRRMRRNNEQLNSTQPIIQNSQSDIEINDITPKHLKTPSRGIHQQYHQSANRQTGSLINKRRQNSRQKLVLNGINGSFQRLTAGGANIHLDNSNFIQNSNIVINNIQSPIAFAANAVNQTGAIRPISAKRQQQQQLMNTFNSPKAAQYIQAANVIKHNIGELSSQFSSPYNPLNNKNIGSLMNASINLSSGNMSGFMGPDFSQKRNLRNINSRKSNGASNAFSSQKRHHEPDQLHQQQY